MSARKVRLATTPEADQEQEQPFGADTETAAEITGQRQTWIVTGRILAGAFNLLEGEKGAGKSTYAAALCAALTACQPLIGRRKGPPLDVMWIAGEESISRDVRPRLEAAGADLKRVHFRKRGPGGIRPRLSLPGHLPLLAEYIERLHLSLVLIDPLSSCVPSETSLKDDQAIHSVLDPLADLARATGCAMLATRNLTKDRSANALDRGLGGAAVAGVARSLLLLDWPDQESQRRVLRLVRGNNAKPALPIEMELVEEGSASRFTRGKELPADHESLADVEPDVVERDALGNAKDLLKRLLAREWITTTVISQEAERAMISLRTLRRAKVALNVRHRKAEKSVPPCWEWGPPAKGWK